MFHDLQNRNEKLFKDKIIFLIWLIEDDKRSDFYGYQCFIKDQETPSFDGNQRTFLWLCAAVLISKLALDKY